MKNSIQKSIHKSITGKILTYLFLLVWAFVVLFPFYWMILTSLKSYSAYSNEFIPKLYTLSPVFDNYFTAFSAVPLLKYFINTLIFTIITTATMLAVIIPCAFCFARLEAGSDSGCCPYRCRGSHGCHGRSHRSNCTGRYYRKNF